LSFEPLYPTTWAMITSLRPTILLDQIFAMMRNSNISHTPCSMIIVIPEKAALKSQ